MLRENNVRTGFFEHEQYQSVLNELPVDLRPIVTFAYITGWRIQSELLTLQWRQVDMKACLVRLDSGSTKNGQGRVLPFGRSPELRAVLQEQERARRELALRGVICPWVFQRAGKAIKSIRGAFKNACERAGCPGRIPHDGGRLCGTLSEQTFLGAWRCRLPGTRPSRSIDDTISLTRPILLMGLDVWAVMGTLLGTLPPKRPVLADAQSVQVADSKHMPRWRNWQTHRT